MHLKNLVYVVFLGQSGRTLSALPLVVHVRDYQFVRGILESEKLSVVVAAWPAGGAAVGVAVLRRVPEPREPVGAHEVLAVEGPERPEARLHLRVLVGVVDVVPAEVPLAALFVEELGEHVRHVVEALAPLDEVLLAVPLVLHGQVVAEKRVFLGHRGVGLDHGGAANRRKECQVEARLVHLHVLGLEAQDFQLVLLERPHLSRLLGSAGGDVLPLRGGLPRLPLLHRHRRRALLVGAALPAGSTCSDFIDLNKNAL